MFFYAVVNALRRRSSTGGCRHSFWMPENVGKRPVLEWRRDVAPGEPLRIMRLTQNIGLRRVALAHRSVFADRRVKAGLRLDLGIQLGAK